MAAGCPEVYCYVVITIDTVNAVVVREIVASFGPGAGNWSRWLLSDSRVQAIVAALLSGICLEGLTPLPGLRLLVVLAVIIAPAVCFVVLWRGLVWLRRDRQYDLLARRYRSDWRGRFALWAAFWPLWAADVLAATIFVFHPDLYEVNPITVAMFETFGAVGVVLAGICYALLVVIAVRWLPKPHDVDLLSGAVLVYALLALANYVLLFSTGVHQGLL